MKSYGNLTAGIIAGWFTFALSASALHLFENTSQRVGIAVAIAATIPLVIFALWFAASENFRHFALSLNPRILTGVQVWRIIGFIFILLQARNLLPGVFALPAGYGDMLIGATATLVAWQLASPSHRNSFVLWQLLGIADLVTAVSLGTTAGLLDPSGPSMLPLTVLPLSLVPTFLVPLFMIFHVICIAQASKWQRVSNAVRSTTTPLQHPAA